MLNDFEMAKSLIDIAKGRRSILVKYLRPVRVGLYMQKRSSKRVNVKKKFHIKSHEILKTN